MSTIRKYRDMLRGCVEKSSKAFPRIVRDEYPEVVTYCKRLANSTKVGSPLTVFKILMGVLHQKRCVICGKKLRGKILYIENRGLFCSPECKKRGLGQCQREGMMRKYGVPNCSMLQEVKEKKRHSSIEKYGVENVAQALEVKEKMKKTNMERYETEYASQSTVVKEKISDSWKSRSEEEYKQIGQRISEKLLDKEGFLNILSRYNLTLADGQEYYGQNKFYAKEKIGDGYRFRCLTCGTEFVRIFKTGVDLTGWCPRCNEHYRSMVERKVQEFIGKERVLLNCRSIIPPQELDIVVPEKNLAIEVNGVYWHSDRTKTEDYHMNKTKKASKKGYRVIHVYDVEISRAWCAVKSLILSAMEKKPFSTDVTECEVKQTDPSEAKKFAEKYNVKGYVESDINLGVFYKGRLVALAGFIRNRKGWTLTYNCELMLRAVRGYIGKVVRHLQEGEVTVNVDRRFSDGSEFIEAGFEVKNYTNPEPNFTNGSRMFYVPELTAEIVKKHKRVYDDQKTVEENICDSTHWARLWDCGRIKMTFKN